MSKKKRWSIGDFSGGLVDKVSPHLLAENQSGDCRNVIADTFGKLSVRKGQERWNNTALAGSAVQGMHAYYYGSADVLVEPNRKLIAVCNGEALVVTNNSRTVIKTGLDTVLAVGFETCVNYMVAFNGKDTPWKYDGTTVSALVNAPASGTCPVLHKEKLFVIYDADTIRWSNSFAPEEYPAVNYWDFDIGDGDKLKALVSDEDRLYVFKSRSIFNLIGTSIDDFQAGRMEETYGAVGPHAVAVKRPHVYFVSPLGFCRWNGVRTENLSEIKIPGLWSKINKQRISQASVVVWENLILVSLPTSYSEANNMVLVYDTVFNSFWPWDGMGISTFCKYDDGSGEHLLSGDYSGYVNEQLSGSADFGSTVAAYWTSKAFLDGGEFIKKYRRLYSVEQLEGDVTVDLMQLLTVDELEGFALDEPYKLFSGIDTLAGKTEFGVDDLFLYSVDDAEGLSADDWLVILKEDSVLRMKLYASIDTDDFYELETAVRDKTHRRKNFAPSGNQGRWLRLKIAAESRDLLFSISELDVHGKIQKAR